jgi:RecA/RadA recombinase
MVDCYCQQGCRALDELLLGEIETQIVTDFIENVAYGNRRYVIHCVVLTGEIYIDTEGTFRPEYKRLGVQETLGLRQVS